MPDEDLNYLRIHDLSKRVDTLELRQQATENFLQSKFPGEISPEFVGDMGELGTDPDLKPIELIFGEPGRITNATR